MNHLRVREILELPCFEELVIVTKKCWDIREEAETESVLSTGGHQCLLAYSFHCANWWQASLHSLSSGRPIWLYLESRPLFEVNEEIFVHSFPSGFWYREKEVHTMDLDVGHQPSQRAYNWDLEIFRYVYANLFQRKNRGAMQRTLPTWPCKNPRNRKLWRGVW